MNCKNSAKRFLYFRSYINLTKRSSANNKCRCMLILEFLGGLCWDRDYSTF